MTPYKSILTLICAAGLTAALAANQKQHNTACKADVEKFCGQHKGKRDAMRECIKANKDSFSAECRAQKEQAKARRSERREKIAKAMAACAPDVEKFCPELKKDAKPEKRGALKCIMKNRDQVSDACKAALPPKRVRKQK
jgi:hypothetical protein